MQVTGRRPAGVVAGVVERLEADRRRGAARIGLLPDHQRHPARLGGGGVYLNIGSAVLLPEVFLKAVTLARNLGHRIEDFTTANFDFIQGYRPNTNVVNRPTKGVGRGYSLTGHHEILVPLLAAMLVEADAPGRRRSKARRPWTNSP